MALSSSWDTLSTDCVPRLVGVLRVLSTGCWIWIVNSAPWDPPLGWAASAMAPLPPNRGATRFDLASRLSRCGVLGHLRHKDPHPALCLRPGREAGAALLSFDLCAISALHICMYVTIAHICMYVTIASVSVTSMGFFLASSC